MTGDGSADDKGPEVAPDAPHAVPGTAARTVAQALPHGEGIPAHGAPGRAARAVAQAVPAQTVPAQTVPAQTVHPADAEAPPACDVPSARDTTPPPYLDGPGGRVVHTGGELASRLDTGGELASRPDTGGELASRPDTRGQLPYLDGPGGERAAQAVQQAVPVPAVPVQPAQQVQQVQQAAPVQAPQPGTPAGTAHQIAPAVFAVHKRGLEGTHRITVEVAPESLGPVRVEVTLHHDGEVQVLLAGSSEASRDALRAALPELRRAVEDAGLNAGQFDVSPDRFAGDQGRGGAERYAAPHRPAPHRTGAEPGHVERPVPAARDRPSAGALDLHI